MMEFNIIKTNPYRILGVFSNAPLKEVVANKGKMKAFLSVGKNPSFQLDLNNLLSGIDRNVNIVAKAESDISLPKDKLRYAMFWFMKASPIDDIAFNHLFSGDVNGAIELWNKKDCLSSLINISVCSLSQGDYKTAVEKMSKALSKTEYQDEFVNIIAGGTLKLSPKELEHLYLDSLINEFGNDVIKLRDCISNKAWAGYVNQKIIDPILNAINAEINKAEQVDSNNAAAQYKAGNNLMKKTKPLIAKLRKYLNVEDFKYQMLADKLGLCILQCGINYFNKSDESDAPNKAMVLQSCAQNIVVGQTAKDRCKENVQILKKIIAEMPPKEIIEDDKAIKQELSHYCVLPDKICYAITLLNKTKPHLTKIKSVLGVNDSYYLKISTLVVENALHNLIEEVNNVQEPNPIYASDMEGAIDVLTKLRLALENAWKAILIMDEFDKTSDSRERYNTNRSTLKSMCNDLGIETQRAVPAAMPPKPKPVSSPRQTVRQISNTKTITTPSDIDSNPEPPSRSGCVICLVIVILAIIALSFLLGL